MVYKRYARKNGKIYGPYFYESYRENGVVKKKYIGSVDPSNPFVPQKSRLPVVILAVLLLGLLLAGFVLYHSLTGSVLLETNTSYSLNQPLTGVLHLTIEEGDSLDEDSPVFVSIKKDGISINENVITLSEFIGSQASPVEIINETIYCVNVSIPVIEEVCNEVFDEATNETITLCENQTVNETVEENCTTTNVTRLYYQTPGTYSKPIEDVISYTFVELGVYTLEFSVPAVGISTIDEIVVSAPSENETLPEEIPEEPVVEENLNKTIPYEIFDSEYILISFIPPTPENNSVRNNNFIPVFVEANAFAYKNYSYYLYNSSGLVSYDKSYKEDRGVSAGGGYHTCALRNNGNITCWGNNNEGQSNNYSYGDAIGVSAGGYHTCALIKNGNITCWGDNTDGQSNNYSYGDAIGVSAGNSHTCALRNNSNITCWGYNTDGQSNNYTYGDAIGVSAGWLHTCALKNNGNITCWGDNSAGQSLNYSYGDAIGLSIGHLHSCALRSNGNITCWGTNAEEQSNNYTYGDAKKQSFYVFQFLPEGVYYINATAYDRFGNSNSTETRTITLTSGPELIENCVNISEGGTYILANNLISNKTCININASNVIWDCNGNNIFYNADGGNYAFGISASRASNITVKNCLIQDINASGTNGYGINFTRVNNSFILNNFIYTNGSTYNYGIYLAINSSNNLIDNNTIITNGTSNYNHGIYIAGASGAPAFNNILRNNNITTKGTDTSHGIFLTTNAANNTIEFNRIETMGVSTAGDNYGIEITAAGSENNTISGNKITTINSQGDSNYGIYLLTGVKNTLVFNNTII
ncbi:MAG: hypothetical protein QXS38_01365, partial [Candidatus Pacearchaeota archaeon]